MDSPQSATKRKNVRYKADPTHSALIDFATEDRPFHPDVIALIFDESYRGCCLIVLKHPKLQVGGRCRIQLGPLEPLWAELRWLREGDGAVRVGFVFP